MNCKICASVLKANTEITYGLDMQLKLLVCTECGYHKNPINKDELDYWSVAEKAKERTLIKKDFDCLQEKEKQDVYTKDLDSCSCKEKEEEKCGGCKGCSH